jgi:hypothetical protein
MPRCRAPRIVFTWHLPSRAVEEITGSPLGPFVGLIAWSLNLRIAIGSVPSSGLGR